MSRHRRLAVPAALAALLALALAPAPAPGQASLAMETTGTAVPAHDAPVARIAGFSARGGLFRPHARVRLRRPGYLALFEVVPRVGAVLLYPDRPDRPRLYRAGVHELRLDGVPTRLHRRMLRWQLGHLFTAVPPDPFRHLVLVVSDRPLDPPGLAGGRVFRHAATFSAARTADALLSAVGAGLPTSRWDAARAVYLKPFDPWRLDRDPGWLRPWRVLDCRPRAGPRPERDRTDRPAPERPVPERPESAPGDEFRERIERVADARADLESSEPVERARTLEELGRRLRERGLRVPVDRLQRWRRRVERERRPPGRGPGTEADGRAPRSLGRSGPPDRPAPRTRPEPPRAGSPPRPSRRGNASPGAPPRSRPAAPPRSRSPRRDDPGR